MPERMDRRFLWARTASTKNKDKSSQKEIVQFTPEELDHLSKLALRLHLNDIDVNTMTTSTQNNKKELNLKDLLGSPEIQKRVEDWKEDSWEEFSILNVESELPKHGDVDQGKSERSEALTRQRAIR